MKIEVCNLETERLLLRKLNMSDLEDYIEFRSNADLHKFLSTKPKDNVKDYKKSLKSIVKNYISKAPRLIWAIVLKRDDKLVGTISIENYLVAHKLCEIGWSVNVNYQGKGIASEAGQALINHLFSNCDVNRIHASIWQGNESSKKLALKLGFTHEGTDRQARFKNGKFLDVLNFGLLKTEWETLSKNTKM